MFMSVDETDGVQGLGSPRLAGASELRTYSRHEREGLDIMPDISDNCVDDEEGDRFR